MINEDVSIKFHCEEICDGVKNVEDKSYRGKFYVKNEKLYVKFDEDIPEEKGPVTTILKLDEYEMHVTRTSDVKNTMYYCQGQEYTNVYVTPYGNLDMHIATHKYRPMLTDDFLEIDLEYTISLNGHESGRRILNFMIR